MKTKLYLSAFVKHSVSTTCASGWVMHSARSLVALLFIALLAFGDLAVFAQSGRELQQASAPVQEAQDDPKIPNDQLDSLVSPIALYPDPLLSQVLVASTYPLEIVQLQQWLVKQGGFLKKGGDGGGAKAGLPSIQAMTAAAVVKQLAENIKWTSDLGNAFWLSKLTRGRSATHAHEGEGRWRVAVQ